MDPQATDEITMGEDYIVLAVKHFLEEKLSPMIYRLIKLVGVVLAGVASVAYLMSSQVMTATRFSAVGEFVQKYGIRVNQKIYMVLAIVGCIVAGDMGKMSAFAWVFVGAVFIVESLLHTNKQWFTFAIGFVMVGNGLVLSNLFKSTLMSMPVVYNLFNYTSALVFGLLVMNKLFSSPATVSAVL